MILIQKTNKLIHRWEILLLQSFIFYLCNNFDSQNGRYCNYFDSNCLGDGNYLIN